MVGPGTEGSQKRGKRDQVEWARHSTQDTHVPRLAQGDGKGHTQEGVEGVALFQAVRTSQGRPVKARAEMNIISLTWRDRPQQSPQNASGISFPAFPRRTENGCSTITST